MFACAVCLLGCLDPICTPETSLFVVELQKLRLSGHIAPPAQQKENSEYYYKHKYTLIKTELVLL